MTQPTHLLYLHGFRSSPQSLKARQVEAWMRKHRPEVTWLCPQLPPSPVEAMGLIDVYTCLWPAATMAVIGSSLGGFYATVLAERLGCRAVVLNPAVDPARDLADHIGLQTSFHDPETRFEFRAEHVDELRAMRPARLTQMARYAGVFAKGDELLDWREMVARFEGATIRLLEGSDHGLSDFESHLPFVMNVLSLQE
jgi:predicted esterase YcpF (UPF0227 family)